MYPLHKIIRSYFLEEMQVYADFKIYNLPFKTITSVDRFTNNIWECSLSDTFANARYYYLPRQIIKLNGLIGIYKPKSIVID